MRSVKRGICPIATLYSLAAAYKGGGQVQTKHNYLFHGGQVVVNFCCPKICCHGYRCRQGKNSNDTIG